MSDATIEQKVIELTAKVAKVDPTSVSRESTFGGTLPTKSIHILQLIALLNNEFDVQITMTDARKNENVGDVIDMIEERIS